MKKSGRFSDAFELKLDERPRDEHPNSTTAVATLNHRVTIGQEAAIPLSPLLLTTSA